MKVNKFFKENKRHKHCKRKTQAVSINGYIRDHLRGLLTISLSVNLGVQNEPCTLKREKFSLFLRYLNPV